MLRCLKSFKPSIRVSESANRLNVSGLIHNLIGWEVSICSSEPDREEFAQFTTKHQALTAQYVTQPMKTEKKAKAG